MAHKSLAIIAGLSLAGILFLVYLALTFENPQGTRTVEIDRPVPRPVESVEREDEEDGSGEPQDPSGQQEPDAGLALEPLPEPEEESGQDGEEPAETAEPVPPLNESDSYVLDRLASLEMGTTLLRLVTPDELVRKFVVFTDNVARGELPQLEYPLQRLEEEMPVREVDDNLYEMQTAAHRRFDTLVDTLVSLSVEDAMRLYERMEPLFQDAYAELGYPERDFNEVVVEAIDTVLEAETEEGPFQLIKPSVMYQFAESEVEQMSPIEKQLIRLGPENTEKLRDRLRDYREHIQSL